MQSQIGSSSMKCTSYEEVTDDAVYTVSTINSPNGLHTNYLIDDSSNNNSNISSSSIYNENNDSQFYNDSQNQSTKIIKSGTLIRIIMYIIDNKEDENGQGRRSALSVLLCTYRTFTNAHTFLQCLSKLYTKNLESNDEQTLINIINMVKTWNFQYPEDFVSENNIDELFIPELVAFKKILKKNHLEELEKVFCNARSRLLFNQNKFNAMGTNGGYDGIGLSYVSDKNFNDFLDFPPDIIAGQLTIIDAKLFSNIKVWECLGKIWSKKRGKTVRDTIEHFNDITEKLLSSILCENIDEQIQITSIKRRTLMIEHWIKIAQACRNLKNFSALKAIISGLQLSYISGLEVTWKQVAKEYMIIFENFVELLSDDSNFNACREVLDNESTSKTAIIYDDNKQSWIKKIKKKIVKRNTSYCQFFVGTIPYLGTFLTDLIMIDTAIPDFDKHGFINFVKRKKEFEIISKIILLQSSCRCYQISLFDEFMDFWWKMAKITTDKQKSYFFKQAIVQESKCDGKDSLKKKSLANINFIAKVTMDWLDSSIYSIIQICSNSTSFDIIKNEMKKIGKEKLSIKSFNLIQIIPDNDSIVLNLNERVIANIILPTFGSSKVSNLSSNHEEENDMLLFSIQLKKNSWKNVMENFKTLKLNFI